MDLLLYRYANESIVRKYGRFEVIDLFSQKDIEGFVISDFNKTQTFLFLEEENNFNFSNFQFHFSNKIPFEISKQEYLEKAAVFKNEIIEKGLNKAIFSRVKKVELSSQNYVDFFECLCQKYPNTFVYLVSSELFGTWIGATPEVLLKTNENQVYTTALAGTKKDLSIDWTNKEVEEQAFVTQQILTVADKYKLNHLKCSETYTYKAGPVYHLKSDINFDFEKEEILNLISDLHPTPAVAGLPLENALRLICESEPHNRLFYTGFLGDLKRDKSTLFVNLRCAQLIENKAFLYLGGGFTKESDVLEEWEETENKAITLLQILK